MTDEQLPRRVIWSSRSLRDLESIRAYIGQFAPLNAQRFTARLVATVERLASQSHRGRLVEAAVRELVVIPPYVIRYRVTAEAVQIVRIKHAAQQTD